MRGLSRAAVIATLALRAGTLAGQEGEPGVGDKAPIVAIHDLDGKKVDLGQYIGKKPVFLEFWATWCEVCKELLPRVRAAHAAYGSKVQFIGINVTISQTPGQVRKYLETENPPFRTLYDDEGTSTRAYEVPATSYVVIVDRSGKIAYTGSGGTQVFDPVLRRITQD